MRFDKILSIIQKSIYDIKDVMIKNVDIEVLNDNFLDACRKGDKEILDNIFDTLYLRLKLDSTIINRGFFYACNHNQIHIVEKLMELKTCSITMESIEKGFKIACCDGNIELISKLLPKLKDKSLNNDDSIRYEGMIEACETNQIKVLTYFFTSSEFKEEIQINKHKKSLLTCAVNYGHLDIVRYLLTSPDLKEHVNIHYNYDEALRNSLSHLEIAKYLLISPELKEHADIHTKHDEIFIECCEKDYDDFVNFLIFDYRIEKTEAISKFLLDFLLESVEELFQKRQFKDDITIQLKEKNHKPSPKNKI